MSVFNEANSFGHLPMEFALEFPDEILSGANCFVGLF